MAFTFSLCVAASKARMPPAELVTSTLGPTRSSALAATEASSDDEATSEG